MQVQFPELAEGEIYLCGLVDATGEVEHTVLIPGDNPGGKWAAQLEWAKSVGGDLPTRAELVIAFEKHRDQFQPDWYWSNTENVDYPAYAWSQGFDDGYQGDGRKDYGSCRARAVRRFKN